MRKRRLPGRISRNSHVIDTSEADGVRDCAISELICRRLSMSRETGEPYQWHNPSRLPGCIRCYTSGEDRGKAFARAVDASGNSPDGVLMGYVKDRQAIPEPRPSSADLRRPIGPD